MHASAESYDVVVAGVGIAGLALVRALRQSGLLALGLDWRLESGTDGLAINLPGNAIAALQRLGVGEALASTGRPIRRREYRSDRGRLLFAMDETAFWGEALQPRCMRRSELSALLGAGLPPQLIQRGTRVVAVDEEECLVRTHLEHGGSVAGSLLVGADGVNSAVRRLTMGKLVPCTAQLASASWRFMAPNPGVDAWTLWAGDAAMLLLIPVDEDAVYGWAAATRDQGSAGDPSGLCELFARYPEPVRAAIDHALAAPGRLYHSPLEEVRLSNWSRGRTLLIGDAAHATAPVWAQGAALAMEDAVTLASLLKEHSDWSTAGLAFEARRRGRVKHVQRATDRMSRAATLPSALRTLLLPWLGPRSYRATYQPLKAAA